MSQTTVMIIIIILLMIIYPFLLHFKLNSFKHQLDASWKELNKLLEKHKHEVSEELAEEIHKKRRTYNALVRVNNHKLESTLGKFLAKKYDFRSREIFKFQGR